MYTLHVGPKVLITNEEGGDPVDLEITLNPGQLNMYMYKCMCIDVIIHVCTVHVCIYTCVGPEVLITDKEGDDPIELEVTLNPGQLNVYMYICLCTCLGWDQLFSFLLYSFS